MFLIAICEDETYLLEELRKKAEAYLKTRHYPAEIRTFTSGEDLLKEPDSPGFSAPGHKRSGNGEAAFPQKLYHFYHILQGICGGRVRGGSGPLSAQAGDG